jgi:hypothetical protein
MPLELLTNHEPKCCEMSLLCQSFTPAGVKYVPKGKKDQFLIVTVFLETVTSLSCNQVALKEAVEKHYPFNATNKPFMQPGGIKGGS